MILMESVKFFEWHWAVVQFNSDIINVIIKNYNMTFI